MSNRFESKFGFEHVYGWPGYTFTAKGFIPREQHPLGEGAYQLPEGTTGFQVRTYIDDNDIFLEQLRPAQEPEGPIVTIVTMDRYNEELSLKGVPLAPSESEWRDVDLERVVYSSTLNLEARVQVAEPQTQIRAVTIFRKDAPTDVPVYQGGRIADNLQGRGFPKDAFYDLRRSAERVSGATAITQALEALGLQSAAGARADAMSGFPDGKLHGIIRASHHPRR